MAAIPKELAGVCKKAEAAIEAVGVAQQAAEDGRRERPSLGAELVIFAREISRVKALIQKRREAYGSGTPTLDDLLRRREAERAPLAELMAADDERCAALEEAASAAGAVYVELQNAVRDALPALADCPTAKSAQERVARRCRERGVEWVLLGGGGVVAVEVSAQAIRREIGELKPGTELAEISDLIHATRGAAGKGESVSAWPGFSYADLERRMERKWKADDKAAGAEREAATAARSAKPAPKTGSPGSAARLAAWRGDAGSAVV